MGKFVTKDVVLYALAAIVTSVVIVCCCSCDPGKEADTSQMQETHDDSTLNHSGYNFTPQQTSNIINNLMHDMHIDGAAIECKDCHQDQEQFLSHTTANALCLDCNGEQVVVLEI